MLATAMRRTATGVAGVLLAYCLVATLGGCGGGAAPSSTIPGVTGTTAPVDGRVVDQTSAPLAGVTVTVGTQSVTTDANGAYHLVNVPFNQTHTLTFSGANVIGPVTLSVAVQPLGAVVPTVGLVKIRLQSASSFGFNAPKGVNNEGALPVTYAVTLPTGAVPPGELISIMNLSGATTTFPCGLRLEDGTYLEPVGIVYLQRQAGVPFAQELTVMMDLGSELANATVHVYHCDGGTWTDVTRGRTSRAAAGADGHFTFKASELGLYLVSGEPLTVTVDLLKADRNTVASTQCPPLCTDVPEIVVSFRKSQLPEAATRSPLAPLGHTTTASLQYVSGASSNARRNAVASFLRAFSRLASCVDAGPRPSVMPAFTVFGTPMTVAGTYFDPPGSQSFIEVRTYAARLTATSTGLPAPVVTIVTWEAACINNVAHSQGGVTPS